MSDKEIWSHARINPELFRDEVVATEFVPGMRFVHATDGITGDWPEERLDLRAIAEALCLDNPVAVIKSLLKKSIKKDDKGCVAVFVATA